MMEVLHGLGARAQILLYVDYCILYGSNCDDRREASCESHCAVALPSLFPNSALRLALIAIKSGSLFSIEIFPLFDKYSTFRQSIPVLTICFAH